MWFMSKISLSQSSGVSKITPWQVPAVKTPVNNRYALLASRVQLISVMLVLVNLYKINDTYIGISSFGSLPDHGGQIPFSLEFFKKIGVANKAA